MPERRLAPLLLIALIAPAWGATGELFCCTDPGSGRRICGDTGDWAMSRPSLFRRAARSTMTQLAHGLAAAWPATLTVDS